MGDAGRGHHGRGGGQGRGAGAEEQPYAAPGAADPSGSRRVAGQIDAGTAAGPDL